MAGFVGLALFVFALSPLVVTATSGAIWTTTGSCGDPQNINHYPANSDVFINGANFAAAASVHWQIQIPGNNGTILAQGDLVTDGNGAFCVNAGTIPSGGPYQSKITINGDESKGDNFSIDAAVYPTPAYGYPTPSYAYPTPAYGYQTPQAYEYPTPSYGYQTPQYGYEYQTPAYGYEYQTPDSYEYQTPYQTPSTDLSLTKVVDDSTPTHNQNVKYTLTVTNNGPSTANNVVVNDTLPSGVSYVSADASQGSYDHNTGVWTVGTLTNGQSETLVIEVNVDASAGETVSNEACARLNQEVITDHNSENNCDSVDITVHRSSGGGGGGYSTPYSYETPYATPYATPSTPGQVLGATTGLPRTGTPLWFVMLAVGATVLLINRKAMYQLFE